MIGLGYFTTIHFRRSDSGHGPRPDSFGRGIYLPYEKPSPFTINLGQPARTSEYLSGKSSWLPCNHSDVRYFEKIGTCGVFADRILIGYGTNVSERCEGGGFFDLNRGKLLD